MWEKEQKHFPLCCVTYRILAFLIAEHSESSIGKSSTVKTLQKEKAREGLDDDMSHPDIRNEGKVKHMDEGGLFTLDTGYAASMQGSVAPITDKYLGDKGLGNHIFGEVADRFAASQWEPLCIDWDESSEEVVQELPTTRNNVPCHMPTNRKDRDELVQKVLSSTCEADKVAYQLCQDMDITGEISKTVTNVVGDIDYNFQEFTDVFGREQLAVQVQNEGPDGNEDDIISALAALSDEDPDQFTRESEFTDGLSGNAPDWDISVRELGITSQEKM
jgi:hypothetical protein